MSIVITLASGVTITYGDECADSEIREGILFMKLKDKSVDAFVIANILSWRYVP